MIESDVQLKTYFEENDFPTEQEFINLIDSKYSKYAGLGVEVAVVDDEAIVVPAKRVLSRVIVWTTEATAIVNLGDTVGGVEYLEAEDIVANVPRIFDIDPIFSLTPKTIHIQFDDGLGGGSVGNVVYYIQ